MQDVDAIATGVERFGQALTGARVATPVTGISFLDAGLLAASGPASDPVERLVTLCRAHRLDFAFVDAREPWSIAAVCALDREGIASAWVVPGVLGALFAEGGMADGLRAIAHGPEHISGTLDAALAVAIGEVVRGVGSGATAIVVADDMAGSFGPLADPGFLGAHVFPRLGRIAAVALDAGIPAILHCDGDARALMVFAAQAGFTAIHGDAGGPTGVERNLAMARAAKLSLIGGVPTAELSGPPRPELARWRTRALAGGGLLLADDGGVDSADEARALFSILDGFRRDAG